MRRYLVTNRFTFLALLLAISLGSVFASASTVETATSEAGLGSVSDVEVSTPRYGAEANPTGDPIGGGPGYSRIVIDGDYRVSTAEELLAALAEAGPGEVVYVEPDAVIDMTPHANTVIPGGVTLAGNRGHEGAEGPLIHADHLNTYPLFRTGGDGVRITGIQFRGPDPERRESAYIAPNSLFLDSLHDGVEVDNNHIFEWSYAGVRVHQGTAHVHHNDFHHIQRQGLGYPVVVTRGYALVEANRFDWYRHAIAGSGYSGSGYEARYNEVLGNASSFAFDMHGGADRQDGTHIAGRRVHIHHNTFHIMSHHAIGIRGIPEEIVLVHNNWFLNPDIERALFQINRVGNLSMFNNAFGTDKRVVELSPQTMPIIWVHYPAEGDTLKGEATLDIEVHLPDQPIWRRVSVLLDVDDRMPNLEGRIYSGPAGPAPGEVVLDTTLLPDGEHNLIIMVSDMFNRVAMTSVRFVVANEGEAPPGSQ